MFITLIPHKPIYSYYAAKAQSFWGTQRQYGFGKLINAIINSIKRWNSNERQYPLHRMSPIGHTNIKLFPKGGAITTTTKGAVFNHFINFFTHKSKIRWQTPFLLNEIYNKAWLKCITLIATTKTTVKLKILCLAIIYSIKL